MSPDGMKEMPRDEALRLARRLGKDGRRRLRESHKQALRGEGQTLEEVERDLLPPGYIEAAAEFIRTAPKAVEFEDADPDPEDGASAQEK